MVCGIYVDNECSASSCFLSSSSFGCWESLETLSFMLIRNWKTRNSTRLRWARCVRLSSSELDLSFFFFSHHLNIMFFPLLDFVVADDYEQLSRTITRVFEVETSNWKFILTGRCCWGEERVKMVEKTKGRKEEVVSREYTINLHKRLHGW